MAEVGAVFLGTKNEWKLVRWTCYAFAFYVLRTPALGCWFGLERRLVIAGRALRHRLASSAAVREVESNSMLLDLRLGDPGLRVMRWARTIWQAA